MKNMCKVGRGAAFGLVVLLVVMALAVTPASVSAQVTATASRDIATPSLAPGETTEVTVTFTSLLSEARSFALQENIPSGWSLTRGIDDADVFKEATNEWVWFSVGAGATKTVTYSVTVPADALAADYPISGTVIAAEVSNIVGGEVTITVTGEAAETATASRDIATPSLAPGETTEVTVTFTSLLSEARSFALQENIPSGWSLTRGIDDADVFKEATNEWVWFSVDAGATKVVTYTLTVPVDALAADYPISGTVMAAEVSNTIGGDTDLEVVLVTDTTPPTIEYAGLIYYIGAESARPGESFEVVAVVTDDTGVDFVKVQTPFGEYEAEVEEHEGITFYWVFIEEIPEDIAFGDHELFLKAGDAAGNLASQSLYLTVVPALTTYNVRLADGWNLVSLPLIPDDADTEIVLDGLSFFGEDMVRAVWGDETADGMMPSIESVWYYDATGEYGTVGEWLYFEPATSLGDLTEIEDGKGYWVDVVSIADEDVPLPILTVYGAELVPGPGALPPTYSVVEGWNLIGFKETRHMPFDQYLSAVTDKYARIYGYDAYNQYFYLVGKDGRGHMSPGSGYWIYMTDDGCIVP